MTQFYSILIFLLVLSNGSFAQSKSFPADSTKNQGKMVRFYPNPATSEINFDFDKGYNNSYSFHVFNFLGKKVHEIRKVTPRNQLNLSNFFRGIYIFQLKDKDGRILESGKFQVVR